MNRRRSTSGGGLAAGMLGGIGAGAMSGLMSLTLPESAGAGHPTGLGRLRQEDPAGRSPDPARRSAPCADWGLRVDEDASAVGLEGDSLLLPVLRIQGVRPRAAVSTAALPFV
mmetsp:Transcript_53938/g.142780  ORF Transcript_53938/g.142780 Transcript_53938/m.142780 type:complete len:113 (-) Transcript_53938:115-453(-)